mmetsp:Transcript_36568/g.97469  ORF Transcript_36568/g.97469 Transcript_36568/m.97469 type:complete len:285 (+) Transcript_36568:233-1087(+)
MGWKMAPCRVIQQKRFQITASQGIKEEWVAQHRGRRELRTLTGVVHQQLPQEVKRRCRKTPIFHRVLYPQQLYIRVSRPWCEPTPVVAVDHTHILTEKGKLQGDCEGVCVGLERIHAVVIVMRQKLWCEKPHGPLHSHVSLSGSHTFSEAEISKLGGHVVVQKNVVQLHVTIHHAELLVEMNKGQQSLPHVTRGALHTQAETLPCAVKLGGNEIIQTSASAQLQQQSEKLRCLEGMLKTDDEGMRSSTKCHQFRARLPLGPVPHLELQFHRVTGRTRHGARRRV